MKAKAHVGCGVALLLAATLLQSQEPEKKKGELPKEYALLHQLVGEWEYDSVATVEPGKPPVKSGGAETVRGIGQYWVVSEYKGTALGMPFTGMLTLGYNADKKQYVGTWIDSMNGHMIHYTGSADGKTLTLLTEAPDPSAPEKLRKFKDVIEVQDKDHKILTSSAQDKDGKWVTYLTMNFRRKK